MTKTELFESSKKCIMIFGVASAVVLSTVIASAASHGTVSTFMWVRAVLLLAAAPVLHRLTTRAANGNRRSLDRLRTVTTILPIAIVAVDLIPGICPPWYAALQAVSAIPLIAVAILTRRQEALTTEPHPNAT
ncbi:hypothetical protein AB0E69_15085 [Kribbella sp. NPDC026611]|uniref:hypothetical protein n=1 Tax=Kribbella sp. NPDC026611 TaxID=3154911 RepID=UPI0033C01152